MKYDFKTKTFLFTLEDLEKINTIPNLKYSEFMDGIYEHVNTEDKKERLKILKVVK